MLRLRFLSAFVGVPILLGLAVVGGWPYNVVVTLAAAVGMWEIRGMLVGAGYRPVWLLGAGLAMAIVVDALVSDVRVMPAKGVAWV